MQENVLTLRIHTLKYLGVKKSQFLQFTLKSTPQKKKIGREKAKKQMGKIFNRWWSGKEGCIKSFLVLLEFYGSFEII